MGNGVLKSGETSARALSQRIAMGQASGAALAASAASTELVDGMICETQDQSTWIYVAASSAADASGLLVQTPVDNPTTGRWLRNDRQIDVKVPVAFGTADAAVLFTVPVGFRTRVARCFWEVTTPFTGGAASTIGLSSSNAAFATKGDLLGAAAGDAAAVLIAASPGPFVGANGTRVGGAAPVVLVAGDTIIFNRITSAFTAGAGFVHMLLELVSL